MKQRLIDLLTLLTSASTLVCCAIPALLVTLGLGATLAGFLSVFPQLIWLSTHKDIIFTAGAILLTIGGFLQRYNSNLPCPIDPKLRATCLTTRKNSLRIYIFSLIVFLVGVFFSFILPAIV